MPESTTTATFTDSQLDHDALTTIVARSVLEAALAEDEGAELWLEIGRDDEDAARLAIDLTTADLEELLRLSEGDDVALTFDGEYIAGLFDAEVEAHGMRGAIAVAATSAALLAPAAQAAVPQATKQSKPQVSAAATAQVASLAAKAQISLQSKPQVSKIQVAKVNRLKLLRATIAR